MKDSLLTKLSSVDTFHLVKNRNRLKVLRAEHGGKSQMDTAIEAEIKQYRYWRIENGYEIPTPAERRALARVFRVDESDVFPVEQHA